MTAALIAIPLAAYGWFLLWRVDVERGWVGLTDFDRAALRIRLVILRATETLGRALLPAFKNLADAISLAGETAAAYTRSLREAE